MLTRLFLIAVFWYAVFRFIGRMLRFLSAPTAPAPGRGFEGAGTPRATPPRQDAPRADGPAGWDRREVIDVEYEEVKPTPENR